MGGLTYSQSGVDTSHAASETSALAGILAQTVAFRKGVGEPVFDNGYYASALRLTDDLALGICTDGVGSKILVAEMVGRYDTIGIDCIAMNVNDLICIGAEPICLVDYMGIEKLQPGRMEEVARGLYEGARQSRISIPGGETAQLPEIIKGHKEGEGLDLVGTAVGVAPVSRLNEGTGVKDGDVVLAVASSGVHSNGFTLARRALFGAAGFDVDTQRPELGRTVGEELLEPTRIYVKEALALFEAGVDFHAMCHITGDGLLNLTRVRAPVGWTIDALPEAPAIFQLIQSSGQVTDAEMYRVFNMGIGLCIVVSPDDVDAVNAALESVESSATAIGRATASDPGIVHIPQLGLKGRDTEFGKA